MTPDSIGSACLIPPPSLPTVLPAAPASLLKRCRDCHTLKPHVAFGSHPKPADRCFPYCRACASARVKRWRQEHPEAHQKIQSRYLQRRKLRSIEPAGA